MDNQQDVTQQTPVNQTPNLDLPPESKKKKTLIVSFLTLLVLAAFASLYYWQNSKNQQLKSELDNTKAQLEKLQQPPSEETATEKTISETQNWLSFQSSKGWQMKVPDGWQLNTNADSAGLWSTSSLTYKQGTPATVTKTSNGRGGPFTFNTGNHATGDPATTAPSYLTEKATLTTGSLNGQKLTGTLTEDIPMDGLKGDTITWYILPSNAKTVIFIYRQEKGAPDNRAELEKAINTFKFD